MVPWFRDGVEIGWRIRIGSLGTRDRPRGRPASASDTASRTSGFDEVLSFTAVTNANSRRGHGEDRPAHDVDGDFDHPSVPDGSPLKPHVLYRIDRTVGER